MKIRKIAIGLCVCLAMSGFTGCGKSSDETPVQPPAVTNAGALKISTSGTPNTIGSLDMTVTLPAGVIVDADATTGETAAGVVALSGAAAGNSNSIALAKFTAASGAAPAQLRIGLVNPAGFSLGECATINFKLDTNASFPASKTLFPVTLNSVSDVHGNALSGITAEPVSLATGT